jgi:hypothetical protein
MDIDNVLVLAGAFTAQVDVQCGLHGARDPLTAVRSAAIRAISAPSMPMASRWPRSRG